MTEQDSIITSPQSKKRRWWLWLLASPFILFALLMLLLYLPPVQRFAVDKASNLASESTGLDIVVGRVDLRFPLDLLVRNVSAVQPETKDTLLALDRLKVELRLWKLFKKELEIEEISVKGATVNSRNYLEGMSVNGHLGELFLESHGVIFSPETARINEFYVKNSDLSLVLEDMASTDTTAADTLSWKILLDKIAFENVSFELKMPKDSLYIRTRVPDFFVKDGVVDLYQSSYFLKEVSLTDASLAYDMGMEASRLPADSLAKGFHPMHLSFESVDLQVDSIYYCGKDVRAIISQFDWKERSGLELINTEGRIIADNQVINIPQFKLKTTDSYLDLQTKIAWDVLELKRTGTLSARLKAEIGKGDVLKLMSDMDTELVKTYPDDPFHIRAQADGNLHRLHLNTLSAELPGAFELNMEGDLLHLTDSIRRGGEIKLLAESKDMKFLKPMTDGNIAIPSGTKLEGNFTMAGTKMGMDFLLKQPQAEAVTMVDSTQLTVHNDTLSIAEDFKMNRAARI